MKTKSRTKSKQPTLFKDQLDLSAWPQPPSQKVWESYVEHQQFYRRLTQVYIDCLGEELWKLHNNGISVDDALTIQIVKGWKNLKAEWFLSLQTGFIDRHTDRSWREGL